MIVELYGGPNDGQILEVAPLIFTNDQAIHLMADDPSLQPVAVYRWLFGSADHLDFAGYAKLNQ